VRARRRASCQVRSSVRSPAGSRSRNPGRRNSKRAQVVERIFQWRAGQHEAPAGAQRAQGLGVLRAAVFHVLGLVGDNAGKLHRFEERAVARERAVTGDDEVVRRKIPVAGPAPTVMDADPEPGRETRGLTAPVFQQRGGTDHEAGPIVPRAFGLDRAEQRQRLQSFPQAHFVGENAAELVTMKMPQPRGAEPLVRPELCGQPRRDRRRRERGEVAQRFAAFAPSRGRLKVGRELIEDVLGLGHARGAHAPSLAR
jgi:hypothetical protein